MIYFEAFANALDAGATDFYIDINNTNIKNIKEIIGSKNVKFIWKTTLVKKDN